MIKKLLLVILLSIPLASFGQQHVLFRDSTTIDSFRLTMWVRQLIPPAVPKINPFFDSLGSAYLAPNGVWWRHNGVVWQPLTTDPDSSIWATQYYVDSGLASISAGAVDTNNYIASITRLNTEIDSIAHIMDSLYVEITTKQGADSLLLALQIETLQSDVSAIDSALGVAFGAIGALYDTLAYYVDSATLNDSLAAIRARYVPYVGATGNVDIGTHTFTAKDGVFNHSSGSGTTLSVTKGGAGEALTVNKTSGSGNAMSVTGGVTQIQELHTTTAIADAYIASAATWNGKMNYSDTAGLSNRINLKLNITDTANIRFRPIAGTNMSITGTYPNLTFDATGGGGGGLPTSATDRQVLYKGGGDTLRGATRVNVDSTDGRLVFPADTTTTSVSEDFNGGIKVFGSTRMGMGAVRIVDSVSIPAALQRAFNVQQYSDATPNITGQSILVQTGGFFNTISGLSRQGTNSTLTFAPSSASPTNTQSNYARGIIGTAATANSVALLRPNTTTQPSGIVISSTPYGRGSGRGTLMFSLPNYASTQFFFYGYTTYVGVTASTPSTLFNALACVGIGKDDTDTQFQFMYSSTFPAGVQKVSTGITPNAEDVYVATVYVSPIGEYYIQLEVINNNAPTVVRVFRVTKTNPNKPNQPKLISFTGIGNLSAGGVASFGLIKLTEEIY